MKPFIIFFMLLLFSIADCYGQQNITDFIARIKKANSGNKIAYQYNVFLINATTGKTEDSIRGALFKNGVNYFDSTSASITGRYNGYYYKIDNNNKQVSVYKLKLLQEKLGLQLEENASTMLSVPDSVIWKYGKVDIKDESDTCYLVSIQFEPHRELTKVVFELQKKDMKIRKAKIEMRDKQSAAEQPYKKLVAISGINDNYNSAVFDFNRFFLLDNDKVRLNGKYKNYHLKTLIN